jgi:methoxymalonate biosynthesis acyl carrier protein
MPAAATVTEQVRQIFADALSIHVPSDETDLIDGGFLDSLALVELLVELEQRFGVSVQLDSLEIDDFRTVNRIAEVISANGAGTS